MKHWKTYKIPKGRHYCSAFAKRLQLINKPVNFFMFDIKEEHWYSQDVVQHPGKNKIAGRTWGLGVHNNSVRVVYQASKEKNRFDLYWYWYDGGIRYSEYIGNVGVGTYVFSQRRVNDMILCRFDAIRTDFEADINIRFKKGKLRDWGFYCFPYAGGQDPAYNNQTWEVLLD